MVRRCYAGDRKPEFSPVFQDRSSVSRAATPSTMRRPAVSYPRRLPPYGSGTSMNPDRAVDGIKVIVPENASGRMKLIISRCPRSSATMVSNRTKSACSSGRDRNAEMSAPYAAATATAAGAGQIPLPACVPAESTCHSVSSPSPSSEAWNRPSVGDRYYRCKRTRRGASLRDSALAACRTQDELTWALVG